ncbi:hypothetical protein QQS21_000310 [Conoideocrella luteorostrata]|uniref:Uncharacterized protein n=1 Tax=Conoideocrella luteorostrata TaxID=1105319 RepID=A0AAJ0CZ94_9HYPO|nr:hypothetical protein QQS21_000310 [Conoideocrella luteorostrata]
MNESLDNVYTTFGDPSLLADAISHGLQGSPSNLPIRIRVSILRPLDGKQLTETELNGGIDGQHCPSLEPLVEEWRTAFRQIPHGHSISHLEFDMSSSHKMEQRHIVRLLQAVSTVLNMKAERREVIFSVTGCPEAGRKYLEDSLPARHQTA